MIPYDFLTVEERNKPIDPVYYIKGDADFFEKCQYYNGSHWLPGNALTTYGDCGGGYNMLARNDQEKNPGRARHYAFLFNTYVLLQIFNEINARKLLPEEVNPFADFFNNKFFLIVLIISVVV